MVDKEQAYNFVNNVLNHLVVKADVESLTRYYHANVIGYYGDITIDFSDIVNRAQYLKNVFKDRSHILHECIVADDKLVFRDRQIMTHIQSNEIWVSEVTAVYALQEGKIAKLWLMTNQEMDYRETVQTALDKSIPQQDDVHLKTHFKTLIEREQYLVHGKLQKVNLTPRELDVLFYTLRGLTAKEIALRLNISSRTVETYLEAVKIKFACQNKAELRRKVAPGALWL